VKHCLSRQIEPCIRIHDRPQARKQQGAWFELNAMRFFAVTSNGKAEVRTIV